MQVEKLLLILKQPTQSEFTAANYQLRQVRPVTQAGEVLLLTKYLI